MYTHEITETYLNFKFILFNQNSNLTEWFCISFGKITPSLRPGTYVGQSKQVFKDNGYFEVNLYIKRKSQKKLVVNTPE